MKSIFSIFPCLFILLHVQFILVLKLCSFDIVSADGFSSSVSETSFGLVSQNPDDVKFFLYRNRDNEDERHEIMFGDKESLEKSGYNKSQELILLLHGVLSNSLTLSDVQQVKNAYLDIDFPANIIMVDYGQLTVSKLPFLLSTFSFVTILLGHSNTEVVAVRVTEFILLLMDWEFLKDGPSGIHIIGFSLGAHIGAGVGKYIYNRTDTKIKRLSGLDPSPQYPTSEKINPTAADFVDVTLTSLGMLARVNMEGHAQFFLNGGGYHQPSCPNFLPFTETYCSHTTATFYFAKSIKRKDKIKACPCDNSCKNPPIECDEPVVYGQDADPTTVGNYYVDLL